MRELAVDFVLLSFSAFSLWESYKLAFSLRVYAKSLAFFVQYYLVNMDGYFRVISVDLILIQETQGKKTPPSIHVELKHSQQRGSIIPLTPKSDCWASNFSLQITLETNINVTRIAKMITN